MHFQSSLLKWKEKKNNLQGKLYNLILIFLEYILSGTAFRKRWLTSYDLINSHLKWIFQNFPLYMQHEYLRRKKHGILWNYENLNTVRIFKCHIIICSVLTHLLRYHWPIITLQTPLTDTACDGSWEREEKACLITRVSAPVGVYTAQK